MLFFLFVVIEYGCFLIQIAASEIVLDSAVNLGSFCVWLGKDETL